MGANINPIGQSAHHHGGIGRNVRYKLFAKGTPPGGHVPGPYNTYKPLFYKRYRTPQEKKQGSVLTLAQQGWKLRVSEIPALPGVEIFH